MPDYYVALVKEYLELKNFIVRTELKYPIERSDVKGTQRTSWGDIDILAVRIKDNNVSELVVGEVKAEYQTEKEIREIDEKKFENPFIKKKLKELFGSTKYRKSLYCWSWDKPERIEFAKKLGITSVSFSEIANYLREKVEEHEGWLYLKDYPNLMLLQFLQARGFLKKM